MITEKYITAESGTERLILQRALEAELVSWNEWRPAHSHASLLRKEESRGEYRIESAALMEDGWRFLIVLVVRRPRAENDPAPLFNFGDGAADFFTVSESFTAALLRSGQFLKVEILEHMDGKQIRDDADILTELSGNLLIKQEYL